MEGRAGIFRREVGDGEHAEVVIEGRVYRVRLEIWLSSRGFFSGGGSLAASMPLGIAVNPLLKLTLPIFVET
jgi:hypothetical protein